MSVRQQSITLRNDMAEIPRLADFVEEFCQPLAPTAKGLHSLQLALEEAVTNVMTHGYGEGKPGSLTVSLEASAEGRLTAIISDSAPPYDPLARPPVDTTGSLEEREIGGLGVHFMKKLMDAVRYERRDDHNILTLECRPGRT